MSEDDFTCLRIPPSPPLPLLTYRRHVGHELVVEASRVREHQVPVRPVVVQEGSLMACAWHARKTRSEACQGKAVYRKIEVYLVHGCHLVLSRVKHSLEALHESTSIIINWKGAFNSYTDAAILQLTNTPPAFSHRSQYLFTMAWPWLCSPSSISTPTHRSKSHTSRAANTALPVPDPRS